MIMLIEPDQIALYEELYHKYRKILLVRANYILKNYHTSEDAVSVTYMKLLDHMDKVDDADSSKTKRYLITIVENTAIDIYRKTSRSQEVALDEMGEEAAVCFDTYDEENNIINIIKKLPFIYREIFLLKYSSGYSNFEMSEILNLPETTIRKRIARGKKIIEDKVNEYYESIQ